MFTQESITVKRIPPDIENHPFDVIIIGAGINGAGIARDAAMRGLKVLLLDKGDIASGTSSWSTRLIHGGLRYLEHGEVTLVRESLRERERLLHIAPHLVKPLPLLIPVYEQSRRGLLSIKVGMIAYDLLSFDKSLSRHRMLSREEALARAPGLVTKGLRGAAIYYDAQVEYAERLVLENVLSAQQHGAHVLTYARVDEFIVEDGSVRGVKFTDLAGNTIHTAHAPVTVNVSGPWVDEVLSRAGARVERQIGGTKGSHIVVEKFPGAPVCALYVEAQEDGRPFFIIPWNDLYLIGTTDLAYNFDLDHVEASGAEIDYLIHETNRVIPSALLEQDSILYTYSGVRPLPYLADEDPASITRRHFIRDHTTALEGVISIIGGKLTTYRNLSEQAVNLVFKKLKRKSVECATGSEKLPGAMSDGFASFSKRFMAESDLPEAIGERLLRIYGTRASEVLKLVAEDTELLKSFSQETGAIGAEVLFSFQSEMARTLTDCLMRRTLVGLDRAAGLDAVETAAAIARKYLGWDEQRAEREVSEYQKYVRRFHPRVLEQTQRG
ncbi:MAG: glycerol-3-phosphate dehydrogenase [Acidobacteriota bacterium]|jgi:glycerol-3-phosphate dehydrogenase|nr:glycerol-3-phosphate dehydrogenase [Acidobacteriota bacterium]